MSNTVQLLGYWVVTASSKLLLAAAEMYGIEFKGQNQHFIWPNKGKFCCNNMFLVTNCSYEIERGDERHINVLPFKYSSLVAMMGQLITAIVSR